MKVILSTSKQNTLTSLVVFPTHLTITITSTTLCDQLVLTGKKNSTNSLFRLKNLYRYFQLFLLILRTLREDFCENLGYRNMQPIPGITQNGRAVLQIRDAEKGRIILRTNSITKQKTQLTVTFKKNLCISLCLYVSHVHTLPSVSAYVHVSLGVSTQFMLTGRDQKEFHVLLSCPNIPDSWSTSASSRTGSKLHRNPLSKDKR